MADVTTSPYVANSNPLNPSTTAPPSPRSKFVERPKMPSSTAPSTTNPSYPRMRSNDDQSTYSQHTNNYMKSSHQSLQKFQRKLHESKNNVLIYIPKKTDTQWKLLAISLQGKDYVKRVLEYHKLMVRVNGMLAGFSFIAFEEEPEALNDKPYYKEAYGIVSVWGFLSACMATIVSLMLFAMLTILGPEGARFFGGIIYIKYIHIITI